MKLTDMVAKLLFLEKRVAQVTDESVKAEFATLQELVNGDLTEAQNKLSANEATISQLNSKVTANESTINQLNAQVTELTTALSAALADFKVEAAGTPLEMVSQLKDSVSGTLAKLNVSGNDIPAPAAKGTQGADVNVRSREEFMKLTPAARMQFIRQGGRLS